MSTYAEHFRTHLRLALLKLLAGSPGYAANASILRDAAQQVGLDVPRDGVVTEVAWLAEQGLVKSEEIRAGVIVATLTPRGLDTAEGRAVVPGVRRPAPRP